MTEVEGDAPIRGDTVGLPNPQADWNQNDPAKADYIKNKDSALDGVSIVCEPTGSVISASDASNHLLRGLTIYGKTTQNGTPTPEAPVELVSAGASGAIKTTVAGKNLINSDEVYADSNRANIYCYQDNGIMLPAGTYTLSMNTVCTALCVRPYGSSQNLYAKYATKSLTFTLSEMTRVYFLFYNASAIAEGAENTIQLEVGSVATEFEPHKEKQTLTASTPNGLPGVPVSSGGNYTDESGQAWVCDEIDFARGVYVKRIDRVTADTVVASGKFSINSAGMPCINIMRDYELGVDSKVWCNCYAQVKTDATGAHGTLKNWQRQITIYDNRFTSKENAVSLLREAGFAMLLRLAKPTETALSPEELAAYAALHSNKPNTTVYNTAGAGLGVKYVADTKNYIDQKLAAISAALLNA
jgi:hypothetical protein